MHVARRDRQAAPARSERVQRTPTHGGCTSPKDVPVRSVCEVWYAGAENWRPLRKRRYYKGMGWLSKCRGLMVGVRRVAWAADVRIHNLLDACARCPSEGKGGGR